VNAVTNSCLVSEYHSCLVQRTQGTRDVTGISVESSARPALTVTPSSPSTINDDGSTTSNDVAQTSQSDSCDDCYLTVITSTCVVVAVFIILMILAVVLVRRYLRKARSTKAPTVTLGNRPANFKYRANTLAYHLIYLHTTASLLL